jgi:hypothetical protein
MLGVWLADVGDICCGKGPLFVEGKPLPGVRPTPGFRITNRDEHVLLPFSTQRIYIF